MKKNLQGRLLEGGDDVINLHLLSRGSPGLYLQGYRQRMPIALGVTAHTRFQTHYYTTARH